MTTRDLGTGGVHGFGTGFRGGETGYVEYFQEMPQQPIHGGADAQLKVPRVQGFGAKYSFPWMARTKMETPTQPDLSYRE